MSDKKDYYEILGVSRDASKEEIKKAYRRLARKYHPDVNSAPDSEANFKEVGEAYSVLYDDQKRSSYDRFGHQAVDGSAGGQYGGGFNFDGGFSGDFGGFGDIFEQFFSGGSPRQGSRKNAPMQGGDIETEVTITLEEAAVGLTKKINYKKQTKCSECNGTGAASGSTPQTCPTCNGAGQVRQQVNSLFGATIQIVTCPNCRGEGVVNTNPCKKCNGKKRVSESISNSVDIPAGIDSGMHMRIPSGGDDGINGGPAGNLYILIRIKEHAKFTRNGDDLMTHLEIPFTAATLGTKTKIENIYGGESEIKINPGTQPGEVYRIKDAGMPNVRHKQKGNLFVEIKVNVPTKLSPEQKERLLAFSASMGDDFEPTEGKGFLKKIKKELGL